MTPALQARAKTHICINQKSIYKVKPRRSHHEAETPGFTWRCEEEERQYRV